jgi:hypothetical protein
MGHHPNAVSIGIELSNPGRVRRDAEGWRIAYTGAERVGVDPDIVVTDEQIHYGNKSSKWGWCKFTPEQLKASDTIVKMAREAGIENVPVTVVRKKVDNVEYGLTYGYSMELGHTDLDPSRKDDPGPLWSAAVLEGIR